MTPNTFLYSRRGILLISTLFKSKSIFLSFRRVASNLKDDCTFYGGFGEVSQLNLIIPSCRYPVGNNIIEVVVSRLLFISQKYKTWRLGTIQENVQVIVTLDYSVIKTVYFCFSKSFFALTYILCFF